MEKKRLFHFDRFDHLLSNGENILRLCFLKKRAVQRIIGGRSVVEIFRGDLVDQLVHALHVDVFGIHGRIECERLLAVDLPSEAQLRFLEIGRAGILILDLFSNVEQHIAVRYLFIGCVA